MTVAHHFIVLILSESSRSLSIQDKLESYEWPISWSIFNKKEADEVFFNGYKISAGQSHSNLGHLLNWNFPSSVHLKMTFSGNNLRMSYSSQFWLRRTIFPLWQITSILQIRAFSLDFHNFSWIKRTLGLSSLSGYEWLVCFIFLDKYFIRNWENPEPSPP